MRIFLWDTPWVLSGTFQNKFINIETYCTENCSEGPKNQFFLNCSRKIDLVRNGLNSKSMALTCTSTARGISEIDGNHGNEAAVLCFRYPKQHGNVTEVSELFPWKPQACSM